MRAAASGTPTASKTTAPAAPAAPAAAPSARALRSPLLKRAKKNNEKKASSPSSTLATDEGTGGAGAIASGYDNARKLLVTFYHAALYLKAIQPLLSNLRQRKDDAATAIATAYRRCLARRRDAVLRANVARVAAALRRCLRVTVYLRVVKKHAAANLLHEFLVALRSAKLSNMLKMNLRRVRRLQRAARALLAVSAARRVLLHRLCARVETELKLAAAQERTAGVAKPGAGADGGNTGRRKRGPQRLETEYPGLVTERVVTRKVHAKWSAIKILVCNYATHIKQVRQRCGKMNATLAQRMPPTTVENPTTEETVSAALSAGVGAAVSVSVASNLAASAEGDPQDPEKIQQRKQQQALTRMWKIRDAMIRRTIVKKRRLHVQALADARRRAELENAVLDERHARLMLQGREYMDKSDDTTGAARTAIAQNYFRCLTDESLGDPWRTIVKAAVKMELRNVKSHEHMKSLS